MGVSSYYVVQPIRPNSGVQDRRNESYFRSHIFSCTALGKLLRTADHEAWPLLKHFSVFLRVTGDEESPPEYVLPLIPAWPGMVAQSAYRMCPRTRRKRGKGPSIALFISVQIVELSLRGCTSLANQTDIIQASDQRKKNDLLWWHLSFTRQKKKTM